MKKKNKVIALTGVTSKTKGWAVFGKRQNNSKRTCRTLLDLIL